MGNFMNLKVWLAGKDLAVKTYRLIQDSNLRNDFGLKDQMQRAAISIPSNIAEGDNSGSDKQSVRFFYISRGSVAELATQIIVANEIGYIDQITKDNLMVECNKISSMLTNLIKARSK